MWKLLLGVLVLLYSAGCTCDCDGDKRDVRKRMGAPEEVYVYDSDGYHSTSWWYWSRGIEYTFAWGSDVKHCCDVSVYQFPPLCATAPDSVQKTLIAEWQTMPGGVTSPLASRDRAR